MKIFLNAAIDTLLPLWRGKNNENKLDGQCQSMFFSSNNAMSVEFHSLGAKRIGRREEAWWLQVVG